MRILQTLLVVLFSLGLSVPAQDLTIIHANVIDTATGRTQPDTTVVIHGNRIVSVVPSAGAGAPSPIVIDARGEYLIPGLWDMHTHVYFDQTARDGSDLILPLLIVNGITGIRDMGSNLEPIVYARAEVAAHRMLGPRMVISGPMLDGSRSIYQAVIPITTPASGSQSVAMLKARGVDFIKVQSGVPRDAYFAIAAESKKLGIAFEGHVPDSVRASEAVASGQRTFEHLIGIFEASSPDEDHYLAGTKSPGIFLASWNAEREAKIIQLLAKNQVWQCPTLFWERGQWLVDAIDYTKDPDLAYAGHSWVTTLWPALQKSILKSLDTDSLATRQKFVEHELGIVRRWHAAGVPFLAGTDTPAGVDVIPGISLHLELQRFVAAGFTPLQALQTATLDPARFYGKTEEFGTVQPGRMADLVMLSANPLENIANTRSITAVVADGRFFSSSKLAALRAKLKLIASGK